MLKKHKKLIVTFYTSSEAMATEKACKENNISGSLISAPRDLTADCGISYSAGIEDRDKIEKLLKDRQIEYEKMVEMEV